MQSPEVLCPPFNDEYAFTRKQKLLEPVPFLAATLHRPIHANKFPRQWTIPERVSVLSTSEAYEFLEAKGGVQ